MFTLAKTIERKRVENNQRILKKLLLLMIASSGSWERIAVNEEIQEQ
jgi:hypothetical protein